VALDFLGPVFALGESALLIAQLRAGLLHFAREVRAHAEHFVFGAQIGFLEMVVGILAGLGEQFLGLRDDAIAVVETLPAPLALACHGDAKAEPRTDYGDEANPEPGVFVRIHLGRSHLRIGRPGGLLESRSFTDGRPRISGSPSDDVRSARRSTLGT